jgi:hypothetical protein
LTHVRKRLRKKNTMTTEKAAPIIRHTDDAKTVSLGPNRVTFLVKGEETGGSYSLTKFVLAPPPAPGPPMHIHRADDELTYVPEREVE